VDLSFLLKSSYWLTTNSDMKGVYFIIYLIFFSLLFIVGIGIFMLVRGHFQKVWQKYATPFTLIGVLGWMYLFTTREELPGLSNRLMLLIIMVTFLIWILILLGWSAKNVPVMIRKNKVEEKFSKYLPNKRGNTKNTHRQSSLRV